MALTLKDVLAAIAVVFNGLPLAMLALTYGFAAFPTALGFIVGGIGMVLTHQIAPISLQAESIVLAGTIGRNRNERLNIVFFTGAGICAESGMPIFQDAADRLWRKYDPDRLCSASGFYEDPQALLHFYDERQRNLLGWSRIRHTGSLLSWKKYHDITVLTQNVDNFHERAGSTHIIHLYLLDRLLVFQHHPGSRHANLGATSKTESGGYNPFFHAEFEQSKRGRSLG